MSYQFPPDIADMVQRQITFGNFNTQDDVLRAALELLPDEELEDEEDELRSLQQSIQEVRNGDTGRPAEEVFAELKARYNL